MEVKELKKIICTSFENLSQKCEYFSEVDAQTGDGDHGVTIAKICDELINASKDEQEESIGDYFSRLGMAVMMVNGGSAGSLWAMMISGIGESVDGLDENSPELLKRIFEGAASGISEASMAKEGEKTMLDALLPAVRAVENGTGDCKQVLAEAAEAAEAGAENTKNMVAKYGRAKNLQEKSLGYLDAGAVSMAAAIRAISDSINA